MEWSMEAALPDGRTITIRVLDGCDCQPFDQDPEGDVVSKGSCEFYDRPRVAAARWLQLTRDKPEQDWAVHVQGRHITNVRVTDGDVHV